MCVVQRSSYSKLELLLAVMLAESAPPHGHSICMPTCQMRVLHTREQESSCVGMYVQGLRCLNTAAGTNADALYCACLQIYS